MDREEWSIKDVADVLNRHGLVEREFPDGCISKRGSNITDEQILEKVDEAMKLGRKQVLEEIYQELRGLFNYRIRMHNYDFDNAKDEQHKYDLSRDAREFNANFNLVLDTIKEKMESEDL